jgi:DNA-binding GntR family transcriptional regulator
VRIMLESFAARLFIERLDEAVLRAMEEQVERSRAPGYRVDLQENFDLGLEFHDLLVGACGNRKVVQMHENLKRHQTRYQHFAFARLGRDLRALDEHAEMVTMLRARDLGAVERLMRAHLLRFHDYLAPLLPVAAPIEPDPR